MIEVRNMHNPFLAMYVAERKMWLSLARQASSRSNRIEYVGYARHAHAQILDILKNG